MNRKDCFLVLKATNGQCVSFVDLFTPESHILLDKFHALSCRWCHTCHFSISINFHSTVSPGNQRLSIVVCLLCHFSWKYYFMLETWPGNQPFLIRTDWQLRHLWSLSVAQALLPSCIMFNPSMLNKNQSTRR